MYLVNSGVYDDDIMMSLSSEPKKFMDNNQNDDYNRKEELWRWLSTSWSKDVVDSQSNFNHISSL